MKIEEMIEVLQAFNEGKEVERQVFLEKNAWVPLDPKYIHFDFTTQTYRIKPQPTREELTAKWVKDNNIVVGSKVKVVKKAEGDALLWAKEMDNYIGKAFPVKRIFDDCISIDDWIFLIESLEPYKEEYVPFGWEDRDLFRGKYVRVKGLEREFIVDNITERFAFGSTIYQEAFEKYEFVDGSIFGKLIN